MTDRTRALLQLLGGDSWGSNQVDLMVCSAHTGLIRVRQSDRTQCRIMRLGRYRPPPPEAVQDASAARSSRNSAKNTGRKRRSARHPTESARTYSVRGIWQN